MTSDTFREPVCSSRRRHFENLAQCIDRSEQNLQVLLRNFDLDSSGDCLVDASILGSSANPHCLFAQRTLENSLSDHWHADYAVLASRSECSPGGDNSRHNSYVSTPLSHKHSPNFSRRNLERIMRSPSLRPEIPTTGNISDLSLPEIFQRTTDNAVGPDGREFGAAHQNDYPLTPPPTTQPGNSERFPSIFCSSPTLTKDQCASPMEQLSIIPTARGDSSNEDIPAMTNPLGKFSATVVEPSHSSFLSDEASSYALSSAEISQYTIQRGQRVVPQTGTVFASSVLWGFPKAIPAPVAKHPCPKAVTQDDGGPEMFYSTLFRSPPPTPSGAPLRSGEFLQSECRNAEPQSFSQQVRCTALEEEFRELLLQQAAGDHALAEDLMGLVLRLDRLCGLRRKLADLMSIQLGRL